MMPYRSILLFGAPGSGKGTQGKILGSLPGFHHCACGDVFRSLDPQSPLGQVFAQYAHGGSLVPDELTIRLWHETIQARVAAGLYNPDRDIVLLDGIPRTREQAEMMRSMIDVSAIIYLICNDIQQIVLRLQNRAKKDARADDANVEVIRHRLDVYEEQTRPVLEAYPQSKIFRVNATQPQELVTADIQKALASLLHRSS